MALTDFREEFDNSYQEFFQKSLVASSIMNSRFESQLKFGESVERVKYDISGVRVRDVSRGSASTIDTITDSTELLQVNLEREAVFHISDGEATQAGPLNPGEVIGAKIGHKVALDLDGKCFAEVTNANNTFDTGDLTTLSSNGTPITLSSTTVPQMTTRMAAKLRFQEDQEVSTNMAFVVDAYAAADVEEYLLGKDIDIAGSVFKNGYAGVIRNAVLFVSENLSAETVLGLATNPTDGDTITYRGIEITFKDTLSGGDAEIHIGTAVDDTRATLADWFNADGAEDETEAATAGFSAASADDQEILAQYPVTATNDDTADELTLVSTGGGRAIVSSSLTDGTDDWGNNFIHAYFGKRGAIDLVIQDMKEVDMRVTDDRRGTNVFSHYLAGIKTFDDGSRKFLDVQIAA